MSHVRLKGNQSTEGKLIAALNEAGIEGWRTQAKDLPSCPDFVFDAQKTIAFVDGCFGHGCPHCKRLCPKSSKNIGMKKSKEILSEINGLDFAHTFGILAQRRIRRLAVFSAKFRPCRYRYLVA